MRRWAPGALHYRWKFTDGTIKNINASSGEGMCGKPRPPATKRSRRLVKFIASKCHRSFAVLVDVQFYLVGGCANGKSI